MKLKLIIIYFFISYFFKAQDKIYFLDGAIKHGKTIEISSEFILLSNNKLIDTFLISKILLIEYQNGRIDLINKPKENSIQYLDSSKKKQERFANFYNYNQVSLNTIALCNSDITLFYEHIFKRKLIGAGLIGAYNFNTRASFLNLFITTLNNSKKKYDLGAFVNFYINRTKKKNQFYFGTLVKYCQFSYTKIVVENSKGANTIKYINTDGYQLATTLTVGSHFNFTKTFFIKSYFGFGGFNLRGDYREQYNYQLKSNRGYQKKDRNVGFLPKLYLGINVGFKIL